MMEVLQPGMLTLPVSARRHGMERFGLARTGPVDGLSLARANALVGNSPEDWALECTMKLPRLGFHAAGTLAVTGGRGPLTITRQGARLEIAPEQPVAVLPGDVLEGAFLTEGFRAYVAVSGGLKVDTLRPQPLTAGARLSFGNPLGQAPCPLPRPLLLPGEALLVRVLPGVQQEQFSPEGLAAFYGGSYVYTPQSDRMGIRLEGRQVTFRPGFDGNILSEPMMPGDIQVPGSGQPIVMLEGCQTVGGYARIAHVIGADLPLLAQLRPGSHVRFRRVTMEEAQRALRKLWISP